MPFDAEGREYRMILETTPRTRAAGEASAPAAKADAATKFYLTNEFGLAALIVVVAVLRGAGVPLSVPGVIVVLVLLVVARVVVGRLRRRRPK